MEGPDAFHTFLAGGADAFSVFARVVAGPDCNARPIITAVHPIDTNRGAWMVSPWARCMV